MNALILRVGICGWGTLYWLTNFTYICYHAGDGSKKMYDHRLNSQDKIGKQLHKSVKI